MTRLAAAIDRLTDWHVARVLPLWARAAQDDAGAFYESLDFSGAPIIGQPRRVRVQCRQIHAFADAARRGWLPEGEAIAARGFRRLVATACPDGGARGAVHLLDDDGAVIDARRDLYDQAFLLLACAARLGVDAAAQGLAERTLAFLDRDLASPAGGYREDDAGSLPRRQNPHMHLFEALMALHAASGDPSFLARARAIDALCATRFIDRREGVLREFFTDDLALDPARGAVVEPGHMAEWTFLFHRFEQLSGEDRSAMRRLLFDGAHAAAARDDAPFLPNFALVGETPARRERRLWPQTELLRAALVMAGAGSRDAAALAARLIEALFESYFDQPVAGLWCDAYDGDGAPIAKDAPASILYHIHEAVGCAADLRDKAAA